MATDAFYRPTAEESAALEKRMEDAGVRLGGRVTALPRASPRDVGATAGHKDFTMIPNAIRDEMHGRMRTVDFSVLMYFVFEFGRYTRQPITHFDVSVEELRQALSLSKKTVVEAIERLVTTHGVLDREDRRNSLGHRLTTRYTLHLQNFQPAKNRREILSVESELER